MSLRNPIFLTAGHEIVNGRGTGIVTPYCDEAVMARSLVTEIAKHLWRHYGIWCITDPDKWKLGRVVRWLRSRMNTDSINIDIHFDAYNGKVSGSSAFHKTDAPLEVVNATVKMAEAMSSALGIRNRGAKVESDSQHHRLAILNVKKEVKSFLCEVCFGDNQSDMYKYHQKKYVLVRSLSKVIQELYYERG